MVVVAGGQGVGCMRACELIAVKSVQRMSWSMLVCVWRMNVCEV